MLAASLLLSATSCSSDEPNTSSAGEGVSFTVKLPDSFATRVLNGNPTTELGDGSQAQWLFYAIYMKGQSDPVSQNFNPSSLNYETDDPTKKPIKFDEKSLSVTFSRKLADGNYEIVLWAQNSSTMGNSNDYYSFNMSTKELSVNYANWPSTGQVCDAFYASTCFAIKGGGTVSATLRRPFAQINIGASDAAEYMTSKSVTENANLKFGLTITNVATAFNLSTGVVSDTEKTVTTALSLLSENLLYKFPVGNDYDMVATTFILAPSNYSKLCNVTLNAKIEENDASVLRTFNNVPIQGNYRTNIYGGLLTGQTVFNVTKDPSWGTPDNDNNYGEIHEAVDLGLSVKWATCNLGAENPSKFGNHYAWGETEPKTSYTLDNSRWYNVSNTELLTLNVINSSYNLTPNYDAATQLWGSPWRMPTETEIKELVGNCDWEWTTLDGHNGYKVTGTNGNSIFLPAAGCYYPALGNQNSSGYYWSSTACHDSGKSPELLAWRLFLTVSTENYNEDPRYLGYSVRPVSAE